MENLYRAYRQCRRHKRGTMNAMRFERNLEENMVALHEELSAGTYRPGRSVAFLIEKPKRREIFAADFRDRVVHHILVGYLEPKWERRFIHDSYACRKGKGRTRAWSGYGLLHAKSRPTIRGRPGTCNSIAWIFHRDRHQLL